MILLIGLLVILGIFYFSLINWRIPVQGVFFLIVFEGALRKWILPQASEFIYFLKDFLILGAYFSYYGISKSNSKWSLIGKNIIVNSLIFIAAGWCIFQAFNPSLGSPLVGLLGLKAYILYIPLIWMLPAMFESEEKLHSFLRSHLLLVIPTGLIGIVQFFSPPSSPINSYAPGIEVSVATFGFGADAAVRVTGTFSYVNSYTGYLIVCFGLLLPLLSTKQSYIWRLATVIELFLVVINMFMSGSRTPIIAAVLILLGYFSALLLANLSLFWGWAKRLFIPATIVTAMVIYGFRSAIEQFHRRVTYNQDLSGRILLNFIQPIQFFQYKELDGFGAGATHPGSGPLRRILDLPPGDRVPEIYEAEMGRVALELGPIGFTFWYLMRLGIIVALWHTFWKLKSPFLRQLAAVAFLIHLVQISGQMVFHHTFSVYYWFLTSFIVLLPHLEKMNQYYREQQLQHDVFSTYFPDSPYR